MKNTKVISFINLKGGVAKTTTTVGTALTLSSHFGKRVLVVDLDPQTNASIMLMGENAWHKINKNKATLAHLFKDMVEGTRNFSLENCLQEAVGLVGDAKTVDLLPSSIELIDVQDKVATSTGKFHEIRPVEILKNATTNLLEKYDFVLIDCPPNLDMITLNGLAISDGYIIPAIPDHLSTYGIPQIFRTARDFAKTYRTNLLEFGIVATKFRATNLHRNVLERLKNMDGMPKMFSSIFRESVAVANMGELRQMRTLKQKMGMEAHGEFVKFADEIIKRTDI